VTLLKTDDSSSPDTLIGMGQDRIVVDGADGVHEILLARTIRARRRWQSPTGGARHTVPDGDGLRGSRRGASAPELACCVLGIRHWARAH
jgi:hypothetical protein